MIITYPTNADYLITDVRIHIGDYESAKERFSDSVIRSSILGGIKMLQRNWDTRYLIYRESMIEDVPADVGIAPSGYVYAKVPQGYGLIPAGLKDNDVFRNPYHTFTDPGSEVFSQEDEWPIILAATIVLSRSQLSSSASFFQNWSDGEYSFSNVASSHALRDLYAADLKRLEEYFKRRLSGASRSSFPVFIPN